MHDHYRQLDALILAAGKGTRMNSDLPKVLHEVADRPMISWVIDAARQAGAVECVIVIGHRGMLIRETLTGYPGLRYVEQVPQLGTGHAALVAEPAFRNAEPGDVLVLAGDMPLFTAATLEKLVAHHRENRCAATLATARLDNPAGYGRIIRDPQGRFVKIVEHPDADPDQLAVDEVNISCYCFDRPAMFDALKQISTDNVQGEYYLTDTLEILREAGRRVDAICVVPADEAAGINDLDQLQRVDTILRHRVSADSPATGDPS
jgi:UDP-N-acetylglucosamine diphosphorylase/glucosamine-1-phosphate N-acetyltransferase